MSRRGSAGKQPLCEARVATGKMWIDTGLQEFSRSAKRLFRRFALAVARRRLTKAETLLGELGWQQAEFSPEMEREVRRIYDLERAQTVLHNESADLADRIEEVRQSAETTLAELDGEIARFESERTSHSEKAARAVAEQEEGRVELGRYEQRIAEIGRFIKMLEEKLVQIDFGGGVFGDRRLVANQRESLVEECEDLNRKQDLAAKRIRDGRASEKTAVAQVAEIETRLGTLRTERMERIRETHRLTARLKSEKVRASKDFRSLDRRKETHYALVGKCLAEAKIAPLNQPDALERVLALRNRIHEHETRIAESLNATTEVKKKELVTFYVVAIATLLLASLLAITLFSSG